MEPLSRSFACLNRKGPSPFLFFCVILSFSLVSYIQFRQLRASTTRLQDAVANDAEKLMSIENFIRSHLSTPEFEDMLAKKKYRFDTLTLYETSYYTFLIRTFPDKLGVSLLSCMPAIEEHFANFRIKFQLAPVSYLPFLGKLLAFLFALCALVLAFVVHNELPTKSVLRYVFLLILNLVCTLEVFCEYSYIAYVGFCVVIVNFLLSLRTSKSVLYALEQSELTKLNTQLKQTYIKLICDYKFQLPVLFQIIKGNGRVLKVEDSTTCACVNCRRCAVVLPLAVCIQLNYFKE